MIRLGIVGCNFGRLVPLPAFRANPRCQVVALAGTDAARTEELARNSRLPAPFGYSAGTLFFMWPTQQDTREN